MKRFLPLLLLSSFAFAEERTFILANYHSQGATALYKVIGHIPENSLIPEGGIMVWSIFDAKEPNANRYMEHAFTLRTATESNLRQARQSCLDRYGKAVGQSSHAQVMAEGANAVANRSPECAPELLTLIDRALNSPWERTVKPQR